MNEYDILPGPIDEHGKQKAWVRTGGYCSYMLDSVAEAQAVVDGLNQGVVLKHEPDPEAMAHMQEEVPE